MRRVSLLGCLLLFPPAAIGAGELQIRIPEGVREAPPAAVRLAARSPERPLHEPDAARRDHPTLVAAPAGGYGLAWEDGVRGILFRRLDEAGRSQGPEREVARNDALPIPYRGPARFHRQPALAPRPDGGSLLVWVEESAEVVVEPFYFRSTRTGTRVLARELRQNGLPAGPVQVLDERPGAASYPVLARLEEGRFLVGWRYESPSGVSTFLVRPLVEGAPAGRVLRVDAAAGVGSVSLAVGVDGAILAVWSGCCDGSDDVGVFARRLDPSGKARGGPTAVHDPAPGRQGAAAVAATAAGYLVAWTHPVGSGEYRLRTRPLAVDGTPRGSEVDPGGGFGTDESHPRFLSLADGSLLLGWIVWDDPFRVAYLARAVAADGTPTGEPAMLTQRPPDARNVFALARRGDGVVAAWAGFAGRDKALLSRAFGLR